LLLSSRSAKGQSTTSSTDKRGFVVMLRDLKLVEEFAGEDGRLRFAATQGFLQLSDAAPFRKKTSCLQ